MALATAKSNRPPRKRRRLNFFFVNDKLHKRLQVNRGKDMLTAWNYPDSKRVQLNYTDTLRHHEKAFTTVQVAEMLNRKRLSLELAILKGDIMMPQFSYALNEDRKKSGYYWREKDIMDAHEYYSNIHRGRPRNDGLITPWNLPTPRELRAMIHDEEVLYIKQGDVFVPTWKAKDF
jgi:hypothetical protein